MATRVLLTIDTELTWRHFAAGTDWRGNLARSYDPAGVGVPYQLDRLAHHGLKACFFVDPMPALVYGLDPVRAMIEPILAAGQDVQLHLHSFWADLAQGRRSEARFELTGFDAEAQARLIATARNLFVEAGAPSPIAFRSGSYAADAATIAGLARIGLRYDSSHNGAEHPWPSALPLDPERIDPCSLDGVIELPVSQIGQTGGRLRPFQLCALSSAEMEAALRHADAHDHPLVTIVGHSFELASRDGKRANALVRRRFDRLCAFLEAHEATMPTSHVADLPVFPAQPRSAPLPAERLRTLHRIAEQGWGNAFYERPARTAALLAPAPVAAAALGYLLHVGF
jgi:hypothetical protein